MTMTLPQISLGALVLVPLFAAAVSVVVPPTTRRMVGLVAAAAITGLTIPVTVTVAGGDVLELAMGGYDPPLGITLRADGMSVLFLLLTTVVGVAVSIYAALVPASTGQRLVTAGTDAGVDERLRQPSRRELVWRAGNPAYWPLWLGCWAGLNAVFVSGDLFNTYVGLEVVGLTAVGLVALGGGRAWQAALRYLFVTVGGALLFLVALGLIVAATGTLDIQLASQIIRENAATHPAVALALVLLTVGLAMKIALVPMHGWLIPAHSNAPEAVSPLLSALVIKASLFVLLRSWLWLVAPAAAVAVAADANGAPSPALRLVLDVAGTLVAVLGAVAIVVGSLLALRQTRLKPLVAYSTVAQVGYWFLFFPILADADSDLLEEEAVTTLAEGAVIGGAVTGTLGLVLGHGLAKATLFLVAGHFKHLYGTDELAQLRGAGIRHPMLMMAMGLASVGLAGLPFSLAFSGKWELATAAVAAGEGWMVAAVVLATLLSAVYLLRALGPLLRTDVAEESDGERAHRRSVDKSSSLAAVVPFILGTLVIVTGFAGFWVADIVEVGAPW